MPILEALASLTLRSNRRRKQKESIALDRPSANLRPPNHLLANHRFPKDAAEQLRLLYANEAPAAYALLRSLVNERRS